MSGNSKRLIRMMIGMLVVLLLPQSPLFAGTGLSLKGEVAIGKGTATRALDVVGKGAFLDVPENNYPYHQLLAVGWRGVLFEATHAENNSSTDYTNNIASPPGTVTVIVGDDTPVTTQTQTDLSFGNIRFNAKCKMGGDLGLYPLSPVSTGLGQFRFSVTPGQIDSEPNARVGMGSLIITGRRNISGVNEDHAPNALDVKGEVNISNGKLIFTHSSLNHGSIYVDSTGNLFAKNDQGGVGQQLTSHRDPREFFPNAKTSFGDSAVEIPFSIHHKVDALGKGAVVDLSKMVAYIEGKMKAELGEEAGKLVYIYTLPNSSGAALRQWEDETSTRQVDEIVTQLSQAPWIKVDLGSSRKIPSEAVEEVPEMKKVRRTAQVEMDEMDLEGMTVRRVKREETVTDLVPTGRKIKRLKDGWRFQDGSLCRRPTVNDINIDQMIADRPALPPWVLERIQAGKQLSLDVNQLKEQIMTALQERMSEGKENQISQAGAASNQ